MNLVFKRNIGEEKGVIYAFLGDKKKGEVSFNIAKNMIVVSGVHIKEDYRDKGLGRQLVVEAANYARENNIKVLPV